MLREKLRFGVEILGKWNKTTKRYFRLQKAKKSCSQINKERRIEYFENLKHRKTLNHFGTSINPIFLTNMSMENLKLS